MPLLSNCSARANNNFARVFLNQDVKVSSRQPQPIDDIVGMRAVPWDDSPPRDVQVASRHRVIDLMPLLCQSRQKRRCNPQFSDQNAQRYRQRGGVRFTPKQWYQQNVHRMTDISNRAEWANSASYSCLPAASSLKSRWRRLLRKQRNPSSRATHHCRVPVEIGFEPNALELTLFACL